MNDLYTVSLMTGCYLGNQNSYHIYYLYIFTINRISLQFICSIKTNFILHKLSGSGLGPSQAHFRFVQIYCIQSSLVPPTHPPTNYSLDSNHFEPLLWDFRPWPIDLGIHVDIQDDQQAPSAKGRVKKKKKKYGIFHIVGRPPPPSKNMECMHGS